MIVQIGVESVSDSEAKATIYLVTNMKRLIGVKALEILIPSAEDLERSRSIPRTECPRRYCWWWHSLSFDWDIEVSQGCTFLQSKKPPGWKHPEAPCKRSATESQIDQYEPREPHLEEDGFEIHDFSNPEHA
jgi:hypothetical protein